MISKTDKRIMARTATGVSTFTRMAFFDNLKVLMMIVVIVHHVSQA